jgi:hypothetical protein
MFFKTLGKPYMLCNKFSPPKAFPNSLKDNETILQRIEMHSTSPTAKKRIHNPPYIADEISDFSALFPKISKHIPFTPVCRIQKYPHAKKDTIARASVVFKSEFAGLKNGLNSPFVSIPMLPMPGNKPHTFCSRMKKKIPSKYGKTVRNALFPIIGSIIPCNPSITNSMIAWPVEGIIFTPPLRANLTRKIINIEIIHVRIIESVITNLPIENIVVDEELTPSSWPAQYAILGNSTRPVRININLTKKLFNTLITDHQCYSMKNIFHELATQYELPVQKPLTFNQEAYGISQPSGKSDNYQF